MPSFQCVGCRLQVTGLPASTVASAQACKLKLRRMDTLRFGRVLGSGARSAAKTLFQAIDAAKAENPARASAAPSPNIEQPVSTQAVVATMGPNTVSAARQVRSTPHRVQHGPSLRHGFSRFVELALKPFVRLSGVMVLEVVGVFFGVFALYGFNTMWRVHTAWHSGSSNHRQFIGGALMLAVFGYFCVTSFLRARRRERGR